MTMIRLQTCTSPLLALRAPIIVEARAVRLAVRCMLLLLAANALFLSIRFADNLVSKATVAAALRTGYVDGSMTVKSYPTSILKGPDQYSDCIAAQLAVLGGMDVVATALAPRLLSAEQVGPDFRQAKQYPCRSLKRYVEGDRQMRPSATYTRFWQGSASMLAFGLAMMPVDAYRAILLFTALGLIALAAVLAALSNRRLFAALSPLLVASFMFCGQISYGQLFSYGPPQIAVWLLAVAMIVYRHHLTRDRLILLAVAAGAIEAFLDQIISVPLIAAVFLIVAGIVSHDRDGTPSARKAAVGMTFLASAWLFGFAGTYALKLLLSVALLGWAPAQEFIQQLAYRAGTVDMEVGYTAENPASRFEILWLNVRLLASNFWRLGFAGRPEGILNYIALFVGTAGWITAIGRRSIGPTSDRNRALAAGIPYIAAATFLLLWVIAFPEHTMRHAFFMVRSAMVWLVGGWGWLFSAYAPGLRFRPANGDQQHGVATNC